MKIVLFLFALILATTTVFAQSTTYYTFEQALVNDNVRSLEEDLSGNIWIGTIGGITMYDGIDFYSYTTTDGLGGNIVYDILAHSDGSIYAATSGGLSKWNGTFWTNMNMGSGLPANTIWCVEEDNNGDIWVGTSDGGAAFYDGLDWYVYSTGQGLPSSGVKDILADRNGNIWFGTGNGLSVYNGTSFKNFNTSTGLPGTIVNEIVQLANGNIAVATSGGIGIYNYFNWSNITTAQGLPTANVLSIREDVNQNLWTGTSAGLSKYDGSAFTTVTITDGLSNTIVNKLIILNEGNGNIVAGSPFNGITIYDQNDGFEILRTNKNLVNDNVNVIFTDSDENVWIGTEGGLNKVNDRNWRTFKTADGLSSNNITAIHEDINGNIWVGTVDGVNKITGFTITDYNLADGLTNSYINSITSDAAGIVYVATQDKVNIIDAGVVTGNISTIDGLADNNVKQVHFENGRIWYLSDAAIQYFDGLSYTDATALGCAENHTASGAKCRNSAPGQYFGDDHSLRFYDITNTTYNCILHPFAGASMINSMAEIGASIFCTFENGDLQYFNGGWTNIPLTFDASCVEVYMNPNYVWVGSTDQGVAKLCQYWSAAVDYTYNEPSCYETSDATLVINSPVGNSYSINNGETWQASNTFTNLSTGYVHVLIKSITTAIIADEIVYLAPFSGTPETANLTISQIQCNGTNSGELILDFNAPATFEWENGNTVLLSRTNLAANTYIVTVEDASGCAIVLSNQIIEPSVLDLDLDFEDITCNAAANGSVSLTVNGGTLPYSYNWSNAQTTATITNLLPNTYSYTVSDGNGCALNGSQIISEPDAISVDELVSHNSCFGDTNGSIDITVMGGTTPYVIIWSPSTYVNAQNDIVLAPAGTYDLIIEDNNGCTYSTSYVINQPDGIDITSEDIVNVYCHGESTGEIDVEAEGGFGTLSYEWVKQGIAGTFSTNQDLINLTQGTYHLTITDENLCETTASYVVNESAELIASAVVTPITCAGNEDGAIMASAVGGSGTYSAYYWYNSDDEIIGVLPHITSLGAGEFYVVIRDSYYCYDTAYATLTQAVPHVYEISSTDMTCNGLNSGTITVTIDGSSGAGFDFSWESAIAGNTNVANNVGAGSWSVTITDPTDCIEILEADVEEPEMQDIGTFDQYGYICYGNTLILNPGVFNSYSWSTGATSATIEVENEDTYFVEVVNASGCHLGDTIQVIVSTVFDDEEINLASVDNSGNVKLLWEKTPGEGTDYFKIYRDAGDGFEYLAQLDYNDPAIYTDTDVDTDTEYYKYMISSVDSCGSESSNSPLHRTCLLDVVEDNNGACWLNWGEYEGFFVVYYFIERGTSPANLEVVDSVLYNDFNWVEMNPNEDGSYYRIKVRRIDGCSPGDGNYYDEAFSNIVFCDNYTGIVNSAIINPSVYPNPFDNEIHVNFYINIPGEINYEIVNMLGQSIGNPEVVSVNSGEQNLTISNSLESGIYILRLSLGSEVHNIRIVKK